MKNRLRQTAEIVLVLLAGLPSGAQTSESRKTATTGPTSPSKAATFSYLRTKMLALSATDDVNNIVEVTFADSQPKLLILRVYVRAGAPPVHAVLDNGSEALKIS